MSKVDWNLTKQEELDQPRALMSKRALMRDEWLVAWDEGPLHLHLVDGALLATLSATLASLSDDLEILSLS